MLGGVQLMVIGDLHEELGYSVTVCREGDTVTLCASEGGDR